MFVDSQIFPGSGKRTFFGSKLRINLRYILKNTCIYICGDENSLVRVINGSHEHWFHTNNDDCIVIQSEIIPGLLLVSV